MSSSSQSSENTTNTITKQVQILVKGEKYCSVEVIRENELPAEKRESGELKQEESEFEREENMYYYLPLYKATILGDWEKFKDSLGSNPRAVTVKFTAKLETLLHVAVGTGKPIHFIRYILERAPRGVLRAQSSTGETALHYAATFGNLEVAKLLVEKDRELPNLINNKNHFPIHLGAMYGHREVFTYLLGVTTGDANPSPFADKPGAELVANLISSKLCDEALNLVRMHPKLATTKGSKDLTPLDILARISSLFPSGSHFNFIQRIIYHFSPTPNGNEDFPAHEVDTEDVDDKCIIQICNLSSGNRMKSAWCKLYTLLWNLTAMLVPSVKSIMETKHQHHYALQLVRFLCEQISKLNPKSALEIFTQPALKAATLGIHEVIEEIFSFYPGAIYVENEQCVGIFRVAIMNRQEKVFNLLFQMSQQTVLLNRASDENKNNILHQAAKLAPVDRLNLVSGAALQMQRELQWFKKVEELTFPYQRARHNSDKLTPAALFTQEHKELVKEGERWMRDTANSCTIAATLIGTIAFAAAITVPGGNSGDTGYPVFSKDIVFIVFAISNALSLFSSVASLIMFLSILTARYAEQDFLCSLPRRLILGLLTLFLSISSMMVTFGATLFLVFTHRMKWMLGPVVALGSLPVTLFVFLQYPLLVDMICSTYGPGIFRKQSHRILY